MPSTEGSDRLQQEIDRHKLMLVTKFLHEAQHEATAQFLRLPRVVSALLEIGNRRGASIPDTSRARTVTVPPLSSQEGVQQCTYESLGYAVVNGMSRGDSGHALEECIFGGRIKHRHLCTTEPFQELNFIPLISWDIC
jgi:hypothetical protein